MIQMIELSADGGALGTERPGPAIARTIEQGRSEVEEPGAFVDRDTNSVESH